MKFRAQSYLILLPMLISLLLAGCASGPSVSAQNNAADRILDAYEVPSLLAQAGPAMQQSLAKNLPGEFPAAERERLDRMVARVYDAGRLSTDVHERLRREAVSSERPGALVAAADTLSQPLPQRMLELESRGERPDAVEPTGSKREQRMRAIESLIDNVQIVSLQTRFNVTLLESMIRARNAVVAPEQQVSETRIERMVEQTRANIEAQLQERVPMMLLYAYGDVSDEQLAEYAALQSRPDMIWTNRALKTAVISALEDAGDRLIENLDAGDS